MLTVFRRCAIDHRPVSIIFCLCWLLRWMQDWKQWTKGEENSGPHGLLPNHFCMRLSLATVNQHCEPNYAGMVVPNDADTRAGITGKLFLYSNFSVLLNCPAPYFTQSILQSGSIMWHCLPVCVFFAIFLLGLFLTRGEILIKCVHEK